MARRCLLAIAGLAVLLHGLGIARTIVPAQDGLKFIRVARDFQVRPWPDVVRGSDQHPLYSALIACAEPVAARIVGDGPDAWRVAAQLVSAVAAVATLIPLFGLARALFGESTALLTALIYALLPLPAAVGRDTLGDGLSLFFFATSLRLGEVALRTGLRRAWVGTGLVAGVGYLARPEILLVPLAVAATALLVALRHRGRSLPIRPALVGLAGLVVSTSLIVGAYATVKGEVSEKLAVRIGGSLGPSARASRLPPPPLPSGLDGDRWNFAPKEEPNEGRYRGAVGRTSLRLAQQWAEGLAWVMLPFVAWGIIRTRRLPGSGVGRILIGVYVVLFSTVVVRHATTLGYLSGRHALTLVLATAPWAGAGLLDWARGFARRRDLGATTARRLAVAGVGLMVGLGVTVQVKAMHMSRWGHKAAGLYLAGHAGPGEAVLDTRGWAMFVWGGRGYDYWHVRQALADDALAYVVVGNDELLARSERAATLRALLAHAGTPVADFPDREGEPGVGVRVYRYKRPGSWEGMRR